MGLKNDIYKAFEKNLGEDFVNATEDSKNKVDTLAEDLSNAVINFITAQTFRVDKLSMTTDKVKTKPIKPIMGVATVGAPAPHAVNPIPVPVMDVSIFSMGVDTNGGEGSNPVNSGKTQSDISEVRLRESDITGR